MDKWAINSQQCPDTDEEIKNFVLRRLHNVVNKTNWLVKSAKDSTPLGSMC